MPSNTVKISSCFVGVLSSFYFLCAAHASETVSYTYDAKGRLVKIVHSGTVNSGVTVDYAHDTADNRTNVKTTGSTN